MRKKVVLVTGITSELGEKIAELLLSKEYIVYGSSRKGKRIQGPIHLKLDITSESDCEKVIKEIINEQGRIDVVINNAGFTLTGGFQNYSSQDFLNILDTNTVGTFRLIKLVIPYMKKQKSGKIINVTSLNGLVSLPNFSLYSASKHAMQALGEALRYELANYGVWITNVAPGAIASDKSKSMTYRSAREKFFMLKLLLPMISQSKICLKIEQIISDPTPPATVLLGRDAKIVVGLKRFLPAKVWDKLMFYIWNK